MKITISKYNKFIYKIEGNIEKIKNKCTIYLYNDNFYAKTNNIDFIDQGILLENSEPIFGIKAENVIKKGKKVRYAI